MTTYANQEQLPRLLAGITARPRTLAQHHALWGPLPETTGPVLVQSVQASGLLGRGGAGFPLARKLLTVSAGRSTVVVANGAEGEPLSGKDRLLLGRAPHLVLDGIVLAARIVGAEQAHLVVHAGSGIANHLRVAISERRDNVDVRVHELPRAYVASEESALVHWLNGGDAKPTFTPPRPFEKGVGRRPTLVNNVETLAHLATIARRGPQWFRSVGDPDEPGTLLLTILGADGVKRVTETPTGASIGTVMTEARIDLNDTSAVLVGGYFGTWVASALSAQLPLTHRGRGAVGGTLGAGILAPLPRHVCGLSETARVAAYLAAHNAQQCGPCLNGLPAIAEAMHTLAHGGWDERNWPRLQRWMSVVPGRGACRHPDGAVRFVASSFTAFASDLARHRAGAPCRAHMLPAHLPVPDPLPVASWR